MLIQKAQCFRTNCERAIAFFALGLVTSNAQAELWVTDDPGGRLVPYVQTWSAIRDSGERVIVDGSCLSACTIVLAFIPPDRLCITQRAVFGFHQPYYKGDGGGVIYSRKAAELLMLLYPFPIRRWIFNKGPGGLTRQMRYLKGDELAALYPTCRPDLGLSASVLK
jgi:hypothetical protein